MYIMFIVSTATTPLAQFGTFRFLHGTVRYISEVK